MAARGLGSPQAEDTGRGSETVPPTPLWGPALVPRAELRPRGPVVTQEDQRHIQEMGHRSQQPHRWPLESPPRRARRRKGARDPALWAAPCPPHSRGATLTPRPPNATVCRERAFKRRVR